MEKRKYFVEPKSLALAASRARLFGLADRIRFFHADAEKLAAAIPREDYDLVYSFGVIHHTPHPRKAVESIRQCMSPHSELRLMIYAANLWKAEMIDAGFDQPEAQAGLEILAMHQDHIFPYVIEKYLRYEYELQPWFKAMPVEMFRALERNFGWHRLIRARLS